MKFVNQPFALWLFTTGAVSMIGYLYGSYSNCEKARSDSEQAIHESLEELAGRVDLISEISRHQPAYIDRFERERNIINSHEHYVYLTNRDKTATELVRITYKILDHWHAWQAANSNDKKFVRSERLTLSDFYNLHKLSEDGTKKSGDVRANPYTMDDKIERRNFITDFIEEYDQVIIGINLTENITTEEAKKLDLEIEQLADLRAVIGIMSQTVFLKDRVCTMNSY